MKPELRYRSHAPDWDGEQFYYWAIELSYDGKYWTELCGGESDHHIAKELVARYLGAER